MYHIIVNSINLTGRDDKRLEAVKSVFDTAGKSYEIHFTEYAGHAKVIAEDLTNYREQINLIAMGGDGTLHEVLNGIKHFDTCRLGLIPSGSGNDFARAAGIPLDARAAAQVIAFKASSKIDFIELSNGLRCINAVGMGMDVAVLQRSYAKKRGKKNKYFWSFAKSLFTFKSIGFTLKYQGQEREHDGLIACIGNGKQIGGGIKLFPDARIDDGYMDVIIVDYLSRFKTLIAFTKLLKGNLNGIKEITRIKCKEIAFISHDKNHTIQAEGELYENVPLKARIITDTLNFYLPKND